MTSEKHKTNNNYVKNNLTWINFTCKAKTAITNNAHRYFILTH